MLCKLKDSIGGLTANRLKFYETFYECISLKLPENKKLKFNHKNQLKATVANLKHKQSIINSYLLSIYSEKFQENQLRRIHLDKISSHFCNFGMESLAANISAKKLITQ